MFFRLDNNDITFPNAEKADADGLLAIGGDLSVRRLLSAYANGIFPWYNAGEPLLWWSPNPRMVLFPRHFRLSKSLLRTLRSDRFEVRVDTCFEEVIRACADTKRNGQDGTWITDEMIQAYTELYREGFVHSFETFRENNLVGGLYGVSLGDMFFGESMFHTETDASKVAFAKLVQFAITHNFRLIDAQQETKHLASLGAAPIPRADFLSLLKSTNLTKTLRHHWHRNTVILSLGSNEGKRKQTLNSAILLLSQRLGRVVSVSKLYLTEPWGFASDQSFLNMTAVVDTDLDAAQVLSTLMTIERMLGRKRKADPLLHPTRPQDKNSYTNRPIDIDILFFNNDIINSDTLQVPHPRLQERRFVLEPLCEILPNYVHPSLHKTMANLLKICPDTGKIECVSNSMQ
jgi:leucyl/phenylalanyl-tRNA--protein transferase